MPLCPDLIQISLVSVVFMYKAEYVNEAQNEAGVERSQNFYSTDFSNGNLCLLQIFLLLNVKLQTNSFHKFSQMFGR